MAGTMEMLSKNRIARIKLQILSLRQIILGRLELRGSAVMVQLYRVCILHSGVTIPR